MLFAPADEPFFDVTDVAPLLTAIGMIVLGILGWSQNRAGRKDTKKQQRAAQVLDEREQKFEEILAAKDTYKELAQERKAEVLALKKESAEDIQRLKDRLNQKDRDIAEARAREEATLASCLADRARLSEMIATLVGALRHEVHAESARLVLEASEAHTRAHAED